MARTANEVGAAFEEARLLPLARENSPGKFFHKCIHYRHAVDADGYTRDQERLAEERGLRLNTAQDGCLLISGLLDPVGGAAVRSALEPLAQRSGRHDDRNREQRFADALVELAAGGKPADIRVTATIETLKGMAGAAAAEMEFHFRSQLRPCSGLPANAALRASSSTRIQLLSTWADRSEWSRARCGPR
jgi:hypothetical protein